MKNRKIKIKVITWSGELINDKPSTVKVINNDIYYKIKICNIFHWFIRKPMKNDIPLIINEIKPLFNLHKLKLLTIYISKKLYLLIKVNDPKEEQPNTLKQHTNLGLDVDNVMLTKIRNIFAFKSLVMSNNFNDSSIIIDKDNIICSESLKPPSPSKKKFVTWFELEPKEHLDLTVKKLLSVRTESEWIDIIDNIFIKLNITQDLLHYRDNLIHNIINNIN